MNCDNCGKFTLDNTCRLNIFPDAGGLIAVAGSVCSECYQNVLNEALSSEQCGESGRWEVHSVGLKQPRAGGVYGREPTKEELSRKHIISDKERGYS